MVYINLVAVIIILVTTFVLRSKQKDITRKRIITLSGLWITVFFLVMPFESLLSKSLVSSIFKSVHYATSALGGNPNIDLIYAEGLTERGVSELFLKGYRSVCYLVFLVTPFVSVVFFMSFIDTLRDTFHLLMISRKEKVHIFSEVNEKSVVLAESIRVKEKKSGMIFANTERKKTDSKLLERIKAIKGVITLKSEFEQEKYAKRRFYEISEDESVNVEHTLKLIDLYKNEEDVKVAVFATDLISENILDATDKGNVRVKLIDENRSTILSLLYNKPIYEGTRDKLNHVVILGSDRFSCELLKAVTWCAQMYECTLKITMIDPSAEKAKKTLLYDVPELGKDCEVNFISMDIKDLLIDEDLDQYCKDATYIIICGEDDHMNMETGLHLHRYYSLKSIDGSGTVPIIAMKMESRKQSDSFMELLKKKKYDINTLPLFGNINDVYSIDNLINSELENMARNVHLAYSGLLGENADAEKVKESLTFFYKDEYGQRASMASAIHHIYKLKSFNMNDLSKEELRKAIEEKMEELSELEHYRWNAYTRSIGYTTASEQQIRAYYTEDVKRGHIHEHAKLHPCLVGWEELDHLSEFICQMNQERGFKKGPEKDLKDSDRYIMRLIPDIMSYNSMSEEW